MTGIYNMELNGLNVQLFKLINGLNHPLLDVFFSAVSFIGSGLLVLPVVFILYKFKRDKVFPALTAFLISGLAAQLIKFFLNMPRPAALLGDIHIVGETLRAGSFPSGHTATALALFYVLASGGNKALKFSLFFPALAVGYSRIYVGAHFPLDVLAGAGLGLLSGYAAVRHNSFFREHWKELVILLLVPAAVLFFRLNAFPFFIVDEARNAEAAREMLERSDFIVPTYNYVLRTDKPPLHYWVFIAAYKLFGINEFAVRLGSGLMGLAVGLLTYLFAKRTMGKNIALHAALIFSTALYTFMLFRMAVPDPYLVFFSTAALFSFYRGYTEGSNRYIFGFYVALGLAALTKGPVGFLLPYCVAFTFVFFDGLLREPEKGFYRSLRAGLKPLRIFFSIKHIAGYLIAAAISVPWYVLVSLKTDGAYASGFFLHHNLTRFTTSLKGPKGSFIITLGFLVLGFLPWSMFIGQTLLASYRQRRNPAVLFLFIWFLVHAVFYSAAATKLPHYLVPTYPALAILTALCFSGGMPFRRLAASLSVVSGIGIVAALLIAGNKYAPELMPWLVVLGLPLLLGGVASLLWEKQHIYIIAASMVVFVFMLSGWLMPLSVKYFMPAKIAAVVSAEAGKAAGGLDTLYSMTYYDPAFEFYTRKKIVKINNLREAPEGAIIVSTEEDLSKAGELSSPRLFSEKDILRHKTVVVFRNRGHNP